MADEELGGDEQDFGRDRKAFADAVDLDPGSLCGSWFHKLEDDEMVWQGIVVGEPQAGVYLVEVDGSIPGASRMQCIVPLAEMAGKDDIEWRFYNDRETMQAAYAEWTMHQAKVEVR